MEGCFRRSWHILTSRSEPGLILTNIKAAWLSEHCHREPLKASFHPFRRLSAGPVCSLPAQAGPFAYYKLL
jgi:hypothetical protein